MQSLCDLENAFSKHQKFLEKHKQCIRSTDMKLTDTNTIAINWYPNKEDIKAMLNAIRYNKLDHDSCMYPIDLELTPEEYLLNVKLFKLIEAFKPKPNKKKNVDKFFVDVDTPIDTDLFNIIEIRLSKENPFYYPEGLVVFKEFLDYMREKATEYIKINDTIAFMDGTTYAGEYTIVNGKKMRNGVGGIYNTGDSNKNLYLLGDWKDDKLNGIVYEFYVDDFFYIGGCRNNHRCGPGILHYYEKTENKVMLDDKETNKEILDAVQKITTKFGKKMKAQVDTKNVVKSINTNIRDLENLEDSTTALIKFMQRKTIRSTTSKTTAVETIIGNFHIDNIFPYAKKIYPNSTIIGTFNNCRHGISKEIFDQVVWVTYNIDHKNVGYNYRSGETGEIVITNENNHDESIISPCGSYSRLYPDPNNKNGGKWFDVLKTVIYYGSGGKFQSVSDSTVLAFSYPNNSYYLGNNLNGIPHGYGIFFDKNLLYIEAFYDNFKLVREKDGLIVYPKGQYFWFNKFHGNKEIPSIKPKRKK